MKKESICYYEKAADGDDLEGLALRELARLHRNEGNQFSAALSYFRYLINCASTAQLISNLSINEVNKLKSYFEMIEQNMSKMNKLEQYSYTSTLQSITLNIDQEILENLELDSESVEAILYLAQYHKDINQKDVTSVYCYRLLDYGGQESSQAKTLLKEIRSS